MTTTAEYVKAIELNNLPSQIGKEININGLSIALFRLNNGKVKAVSNACPHKNGPLAEGIVTDEYVFCPMHNWKISLDTGEVQKPDDGCIKTYETKIIDGYVFIEL